MAKTIAEVQSKLDRCILAVASSTGGSFTHSVEALVKNAKASANVGATVTYIGIPEVARALSNIRNYLETNCLLKNSLGQYVITEKVLEEALARLEKANEDIQAKVGDIIGDYNTVRDNFKSQMQTYLEAQLGKKASVPVLKDVMAYYPSVSMLKTAGVFLRLDYVDGSNTTSLNENTIKVVDESKAEERARNYHDMVIRAILPIWSSLGRMIQQAVTGPKMGERTMTAYRQQLNRLGEDNAILCDPTLENFKTCGFMALNNGDIAEIILANIYRMAKTMDVETQLPEIPNYNRGMLETIASDPTTPSLEDMVEKAKKILGRQEEEDEAE